MSRLNTEHRWVLLACLAIAGMGLLLCLWQTLQTLKLMGAAPIPEIVLQQSPVRVVSSSDPRIFPPSWRTAKIQAKAKGLQSGEVERTRRILKRAINKYPRDVLERNLRTVYVLSELDYRGIRASGTNSRQDIYIENRGIAEGFTDAWVEETFHHEFASILLRNYPQYFDSEAWNRINPATFHYGEDGVEAVMRNRADETLRVSLCENGFLCEYSQASMETDFNTMAEHLFTGDAEFLAAVNEYPKLKAKQDLVLAFYQRLDAKFDKTFFKLVAKQIAETKTKLPEKGFAWPYDIKSVTPPTSVVTNSPLGDRTWTRIAQGDASNERSAVPLEGLVWLGQIVPPRRVTPRRSSVILIVRQRYERSEPN